MSWNNETYLIGEKVRVTGEKEHGVVTRIDVEKGLIHVLYKRMREETYAFPESIHEQLITPVVAKKH